MRIVHAAASIAPRDGGPSTAALGINRALRELGVPSVIVSTDADGSGGRLDGRQRLELIRAGGAVFFCRRSRPYLLKHSWQQGLRMLRCCSSGDVMHVHGVYLANSIWAFLVAAARGSSYVVQPHGTLEPYQQGFSRLRKRLFDRVIGNRILAGAAALIAASESEAGNLRALLPGATVVTVPLGVTRREPAIAPELHRQLTAWLAVPQHQRVLFLGRLAAKKRPDLLLSAWTQADLWPPDQPSPPGHLLIVGPAQDWNAGTLSARIPPENRDSVTFLDAVDPPTAAWLMTEAGIFTLPSENENFALSVAEAMSYGCAIITTAQTAACEHVRAASAGIVLPHPEAGPLREALVELLTDPVRVAHLGQSGRQYAEAELTWTRTASRLNQAYGQLTDARR